MNTDLQGNASFAEVYHFLKDGGDKDTFQCFKSLFSVALLVFPAFMGKEVALITDLATGATLAGAGIGAIVGNAAKSAFSFFKHRDHGGYKSRYEQMQIAQVMLVYAAYFDTISQYLPNENGEITLSPELKSKISQNGLKSYLKGLEKAAQQNTGMHKLLETGLALPDQTQGFSQYKERLEKFYTAMNDEFIKFFEQTRFWEELDSDPDGKNLESNQQQQKFFYTLLQELPETAVATYEKQYFGLSREFPDFAVWANRSEHTQLSAQIDVGFQRAAERMQKLISALPDPGSKAAEMLEHYQKKYAGYVTDSIIEHDADNSFEDVVFPEKREIFIPQAFQALAYHHHMQLEREDTWSEAYQGEDIGKHVSSVLRHPKYCGQPMLILGLPGAGKTLLCHMLAAQILSTEYFVIIIRLRDTNADEKIMQQVNAQIERDLGENCTWSDLRNACLDKPILLIFDGYDELLQASGKTYSDYLRSIADFQAEERRIYGLFVRCIVTSRVTLIDKASIPRDSQILRLCDFDNARIEKWCDIWNQRNSQYFASHSLKKFEVASSGRAKELARQPLLLLMLALYEMNGGHLQKQDNISRAKLYYQLIRDFVVRERKKDSEFNHKTPDAQDKLVQNDFLHLGIAALGMYNRKKLFIQSKELGKDLAFLTRTTTEADDTDERALSESDQLIGSFFFIHTSSAPTGGGTLKVSAYEFLHNTFGEFLTAYYILHTAFLMIKRQRSDEESGEAFSWTPALRKSWYAGLAYTPLFTRPVVLNMIHELSNAFFQERGLDAKKVQNVLDTRFHEELHDIISGESFHTIHEMLNMQGNPYKHPELMVHVAAYSVNLILLRATICTGSFIFTDSLGSSDDWKKLTHIWRYAFSEEELVSLSCLINLKHADNMYTLTYMYDESADTRAGMLSKLGRLVRVSEVLGDDAEFAIFSSVRGQMTSQIERILDKERLRLRTRYALNRLSECLISSKARKGDHYFRSSMAELYRCCSAEDDVIGLLVYCMLLRTFAERQALSKQDMSLLLDRDSFMRMERTIHFAADFSLRNLFLTELLGCVKYLPNAEQWPFLEVFYDHCNQYYRRFAIGRIGNDKIAEPFLEALNSALPRRRPPEGLCFAFFRALDLYGLWRLAPQVIQICQSLNNIGYRDESDRIFDFFFQQDNSKGFTKQLIEDMRRDPVLLGAIIDCLYHIRQNHYFKGHDHVKFRSLEDAVFRNSYSVETLLPNCEESFYHLLCLICDNESLWRYVGLPLDEAEQIVKKYGEILSVRTLKKLVEYGQVTGCEPLVSAIDHLLYF